MIIEEDAYLEHYGVKGMRWGVRRRRGSNVRVATEAKRRDKTLEKYKQKGKPALTNKELADFNKRMELESKFDKFNEKPKRESKVKKGHTFARDILAIGATANAAIAFSRSPAGQKVASAMKSYAQNAARNAGGGGRYNTRLALPRG